MSNKKILLICCLFFMIFVCNSAFARLSGRPQACASNIRIIQGAVEMYNMDSKISMKHLDNDSMKELIKGKYLKEEPEKPETSCEYKSIGDLSKEGEGEGIIFCTYHGDLEHLVYSEYHKYDEYEKLSQNATYNDVKTKIKHIISERDKFREKEEKEKERNELIKKFIYFLPFIMAFIFVLFYKKGIKA